MTPKAKPAPTPAQAYFSVIVLSALYACSYMDRQLPNLLLQPIKADLHLNDTSVSLLSGLSFAILYSIVGLPLAKLADQWSRRGVIAGGVVLWGAASTMCGAVATFGQFFLARMGVGLGEAALVPASYSLVADLFPGRGRARAMGIFVMGGAIGTGLAMLLGAGIYTGIEALRDGGAFGWLDGTPTWRLVLVVTGLLTLALAPLILLISDPQFSGGARPPTIPFRQVMALFWRERRAYMPLLLGVPMINIAIYGFTAWAPTLLIRTHGWSIGQAGLGVGVASVIGGILGALSAGWLPSDLSLKTPAAPVLITAAASLACTALACIICITPFALVQLALIGAVIALMYLGGTLAAVGLQEVAPSGTRAQFSSVYSMLASLMGVGFGPTLVALLTDRVFKSEAAVGYSMALAWVIVFAVCGPIMVLNRKAFTRVALAQRSAT